MAGGDVFGQLLKLLREPVSPVVKLRRLTTSAGAISRLGPRERAVLLRMTGLRGAEALIDRLAAGDRQTQRALHRLLHRIDEEPGEMADTIRGLADPRRRTEAVAELVDALDDALDDAIEEEQAAAETGPEAEPEKEPDREQPEARPHPPEALADPPEAQSNRPEARPHAPAARSAPADDEPLPVFVPVTPPVPQPRRTAESADGSRTGPEPPTEAPGPAATPPPVAAKSTPPGPSPAPPVPDVGLEIPPEAPAAPSPAPASIWKEPEWAAPPVRGSGPPTGAVSAAGLGERRVSEPPPSSVAVERPAAPAVLDRLVGLRRRLEAGRPVPLTELVDLVEHDLPYPWARRRALLAWIEGAGPFELTEGLDRLLALVAELPGPAQRGWCLGALAAARPWSDDDWARITATAGTKALRHRLERRRR